jgi:predicted O-methyltransferase YrrM
MDISKALTLDGWMREPELDYLAKQASTRKQIIEIGSWCGRSTVGMAANTRGVVTCVDTWGGSGAEHAKILDGKDPDWLWKQFLQNTLEFPNIQPIRGDSYTVGLHYTGPKADMIFIDGNHTYEAVSRDIRVWLPHLAPGGLLCGHDFSSSFPGVVRAVKELVRGAGPTGAGSIWARPL